MKSSNTPLEAIGSIRETAKYYLENRLDTARLEMAKQSSEITSNLITSLVIMTFGFVLYIFIMLTLGLLLGQYFDSIALGFAVVSGIIILNILVVYVFKKQLITNRIVDQVLSQINYDEVNTMQELEMEQMKLKLMQQNAEEVLMDELKSLPQTAFDDFLNRKVLSSQLAGMTAYGIQTAANHFVGEQQQRPTYQEWWRPFVPILVDFAKDYLQNYLENLRPVPPNQTANAPDPSPTAPVNTVAKKKESSREEEPITMPKVAVEEQY